MKNLNTVLVLCCLSCAFNCQEFEDIGDDIGLFATSLGATYGVGLSFYDFDHDGWDDITISDFSDGIKFYRNSFGILNEVDLGIEVSGDIKSVNWVDIDNDGDADLFVLKNLSTPKLFENLGDLIFADVSVGVGFLDSPNQNNFNSCWGDYDKDGLLDVYISNYSHVSYPFTFINRLYHNNGDKTFTDVTELAGVDNGIKQTLTSVWMDYNLDGWPDIYVANDRTVFCNSLYKNNGDGTFTDVAPELGLDMSISCMSNSHADYDNDSDLDLFISNTCQGNWLMNNDNNESFSNVAQDAGVITNFFCWGANWIDIDNDADQDIYISTAYCAEATTDNFLYKNNGDGTFTSINEAIQNNIYIQHGNAIGDYDNNGLMDILAVNQNYLFSTLYKNVSDFENNYVKITLEGQVSNKDGVGSWIEVYSGGLKQIKYTFSNEDYMSQDSQNRHFGLGTSNLIDSIHVCWLSGHRDTYYNLPANQHYNFFEGETIDVPIYGLMNCSGEASFLFGPEGFNSYEWSTGESEEVVIIYESQSINLTVTNEFGVSNTSEVYYFEPHPIPIVTSVSSQTICNGENNGSFTVENLTGNGIESILWSNDSTSSILTNLAPGSYWFSLTDINGCYFASDTLDIMESDAILLSYSIVEPNCYGECLGVFNYNLSGGYGSLIYDGPEDNLCSGVYDITITDDLGCLLLETIVVNQPDELVVQLQIEELNLQDPASALLEVTGGTMPYEIEWSTGQNELQIDDLFEGDYWVQVSDSLGCEWYYEFEIATGIEEFLMNPTQIYPNPSSGIFKLNESVAKQFKHYRIYTYDGKLISEGILHEPFIDITNLANSIYHLELVSDNSSIFVDLIKE